jgi:hypothetical protein
MHFTLKKTSFGLAVFLCCGKNSVQFVSKKKTFFGRNLKKRAFFIAN